MTNNNSGKQNLFDGVSLALTFVVLSVVLYFFPSYLGNVIITRIFCIIFGLIGVLGLSSELTNVFKFDISDFGLGFFCLILWAILYNFFSDLWYVNAIGLIILLFAAYGVISGFLKAMKFVMSKKTTMPSFVKSLFVFATQLLAFAFTLLQILKLIGIFK